MTVQDEQLRSSGEQLALSAIADHHASLGEKAAKEEGATVITWNASSMLSCWPDNSAPSECW